MTQGDVLAILQESLLVALKLSAPMLVISIAIGLVIAIFQAATQIHEQTIGFILKVSVIVAVLLLGGGWMLESLQEYTREIFALIGS